MKLKIAYIDTAKLIPYCNNSRTHSEEQVAQIASSIKEFGFTNPVLIDEDGGLIAGHGRTLAAKLLKMAAVPSITLTCLTPAQKKAYVIADNQLALNAGWDLDALKIEIETLNELEFDTSLLGFDDDFLAGLMEEEPSEGLTDEDAVPDAPDNPVSVLGDIWQLGNHRLMCGDSTSIDAVERLMDGQKADMVFTDPPYGVDYDGGIQFKGGKATTGARKKLENDHSTDIYTDVIPVINAFLNGPAYIWFAGTKARSVYQALEDNSFDLHALIIWEKNGGYGALNANYKQKHEPCLYVKPKGGKLDFCGATTETTIWKIDKDGKNKLHPTQKPVELAEKAIRNHSAGLIMDLFGGSGSTLIGCEKANRNCRMMEMSEPYVDVIINRWQDFTGKEATHTETGKTYAEMKAKHGTT